MTTSMINPKKILITGGDGYVGTNLLSFLNGKNQIVVPAVIAPAGLRDEVVLDITSATEVKKLLAEVKPDLVIHTAGLSSLAKCEHDSELARRINFEGTKNLVDHVGQAKFVFFSSDYVFAGDKGNYSETDLAEPRTVYGQTKLLAEKYIQENHKNYLIIRTANIFGRGGNFFNFVLSSLKAGQTVEVFDDVSFTPTQIDFLLNALYELIETDFRGIIHLAGQDKVSRYEFANLITEELGAAKKLVKKISQPKDGLISKDSSLKTDLLRRKTNAFSPPITQAIHASLNNLVLPYFNFSDGRGEIEGIFQGKNWQEINIIRSIKGCIRGNHYHRETLEAFYVIEGKIKVTLVDIKTKEKNCYNLSAGDIFTIPLMTNHTFEILETAEWINMLSKPTVPGHEDIHKQ